MQKNKKLYVAYGSNLNLRQMAMRCPNATPLGIGEIDGYELQFKGQPHGAYATIDPKEGASVPVLVWELGRGDEKALDIYEGVSNGHYYKQDIPVQMGDRTVSAMVYIMNPKMTFGIPTQRYYNAVLEGYENCELDPRMLNEAVDKSIAAYREWEQQRRVFQASRFYEDIGDMCDETFDMDEQMHF